jgi:hypothetical protein
MAGTVLRRKHGTATAGRMLMPLDHGPANGLEDVLKAHLNLSRSRRALRQA